jgi:hypothetical protein
MQRTSKPQKESKMRKFRNTLIALTLGALLGLGLSYADTMGDLPTTNPQGSSSGWYASGTGTYYSVTQLDTTTLCDSIHQTDSATICSVLTFSPSYYYYLRISNVVSTGTDSTRILFKLHAYDTNKRYLYTLTFDSLNARAGKEILFPVNITDFNPYYTLRVFGGGAGTNHKNSLYNMKIMYTKP